LPKFVFNDFVLRFRKLKIFHIIIAEIIKVCEELEAKTLMEIMGTDP
jgi:hypothetical protein